MNIPSGRGRGGTKMDVVAHTVTLHSEVERQKNPEFRVTITTSLGYMSFCSRTTDKISNVKE